MEIRQLRYFDAVSRHRHFTRAAEELHVAQSALSHQVRRLELELGIELLNRTTRSVEPTEAGILVAARARRILDEADLLRGEVDELRGLVRGRVIVGALLFGGQLDIPALLASFTSSFPQIEVGLREGTAQRMADGLRDGSIDLAFALEAEPTAVAGPPRALHRGAGRGDGPGSPAGRPAPAAPGRAHRRAADRLRARRLGAPARRPGTARRRSRAPDQARGQRPRTGALAGRRRGSGWRSCPARSPSCPARPSTCGRCARRCG